MSKTIKICFFSPASYPFFNPENKNIHGGAEFQMFLLAGYLAKNSLFKITFIVGDYGQKEKENFENIHLLKAFNLSIKESFFSKVIKAFRLFFIYKKIKPDILVNTTANSITGLAAFYKNLYKKKLIYRTASDINVNKQWIKSHIITGKFFQYGIENADVVTVQSKKQQIWVQKYHYIKAVLLKNAFPVKPFQNQEKKFVLWVSRFAPMKNPELFLKLAQEIPEEKFVMICPYNPSDYKKWKVLKNKAQNISNLTFIEKVPFAEIQAYFNQAKLFVNTSDYEGFPNTFLQAAQAQTPIISLSVNPDNFIDEYNCGIFCYNDFKQLVEQTKKLLQNPDEINLKGKNAYRYLKENHDINKIGKRFEELILSLF